MTDAKRCLKTGPRYKLSKKRFWGSHMAAIAKEILSAANRTQP